MKWITVVVVSLLWSAGAACAQETFFLGLTGGGPHFPLPSECGQQINCPITFASWSGTMRIVTASGADGVYAGDSVLALDFTSDQVEFDLHNIRTSVESFGSPAYSVTLAGNQVVSVDFAVQLNPGGLLPAPTVVTFSGLSGGFDVPVSHRLGATFFRGTLVPIPEPATWALLLAGATMLAAMRRAHS